MSSPKSKRSKAWRRYRSEIMIHTFWASSRNSLYYIYPSPFLSIFVITFFKSSSSTDSICMYSWNLLITMFKGSSPSPCWSISSKILSNLPAERRTLILLLIKFWRADSNFLSLLYYIKFLVARTERYLGFVQGLQNFLSHLLARSSIILSLLSGFFTSIPWISDFADFETRRHSLETNETSSLRIRLHKS